MKASAIISLFLAILLMFGQVWALKRANTGELSASAISGLVTDEYGEGVSHVKVSIINEEGKLVQSLDTDPQGMFKVEGIPAGSNYTVVFSSAGYAPTTFEDVTLRPGDRASLVGFLTQR
jgi:hypothetical protein